MREGWNDEEEERAMTITIIFTKNHKDIDKNTISNDKQKNDTNNQTADISNNHNHQDNNHNHITPHPKKILNANNTININNNDNNNHPDVARVQRTTAIAANKTRIISA